MSQSTNDMENNTNNDKNSEIQQTVSLSTSSTTSQSSSPPHSALLVIDDILNPNELSLHNTNNIPTKSLPIKVAQNSTTSPSSHDVINETVEQQCRRNSFIAKLLGGQPLNNQQYEEINQQILDDKTAHNAAYNNDNGFDNGIQRSRSSITRTLLMNGEPQNNTKKMSNRTQSTSLPSSQKNVEYLIRQELDKIEVEHGPSTNQFNSSPPKMIQNLNSIKESKLKRKRDNSQLLLTTSNTSSINSQPVFLHNPFELESSTACPISDSLQNESSRYCSSKRFRHSFSNPQNLSMNKLTNQSFYPYNKTYTSSLGFNQLNLHDDRISPGKYLSSSDRSHYSNSNLLKLPLPVSSANESHDNHNNTATTFSRKVKSMIVQPGLCELPRQRSYSSVSKQSNSSFDTSSEPNVPLKKRLLHAYNNEQNTSSSL